MSQLISVFCIPCGFSAPGKGASFRVLANSRYAGRLTVWVEECKVYDLLQIFYLTYRMEKDAGVLVWPVFSDGEETEELYESVEGFPKENESRKRGTEYNPDYEVREYVAGDELKSIHWKLSAKQDKLMVRERLAAGKEKINVLLPLGERAVQAFAYEGIPGSAILAGGGAVALQPFYRGTGGA